MRRAGRVAAAGVAVAGAALAALYLGLIASQGTGLGAVPLLFTALFLALGVLPLVGLRLKGFAGSFLVALAATGWSVLAVLTGFSIGLAVVPIALLAILCLVVSLRLGGVAAVAPAIAGVLAGVILPFLLIRLEPYLPPSCDRGQGSYSGEAAYPGPLYGDLTVTYSCSGGHLRSWTVKQVR